MAANEGAAEVYMFDLVFLGLEVGDLPDVVTGLSAGVLVEMVHLMYVPDGVE